MIEGQTMFQYLKRQKKIVFSQSSNNKLINTSKQLQLERDIQKTQRNNQKSNDHINTQRTINKYQQEQVQSKISRRNIIVQQTSQNKMRSFLKLISPIRNKSSGQREESRNESRQLNDKKAKMKDNYTKFMLQQKINLMRQTIQNFIKEGKNLKQKAKLLFIDVQPLLRHVQKCQDAGFQRKTENVKAKIKSLQSVLRDLKVQQSESAINEFYLYFCQHLNQVQGNAIAEISQTRDSLQNQILQNNNVLMQQLKSKNVKMQRQISIWMKKYDKSEKRAQSLNEQLQRIKSTNNEIDKRKSNDFQAEITKYLCQIEELKSQNESLRQRANVCQSQRKQAIFAKQKYQTEYLNNITKVKSQQEQFLLNEIMILKRQFSADINKISELHKIKQLQLIDRSKGQQIQIGKLKNSIEDFLDTNRILEQSITTLKAQNTRLKKHNDCLATDMHRINEQLYQHWLALKDIKTLSTRLDIFNKFKKIYEELLFNEQLFL